MDTIKAIYAYIYAAVRWLWDCLAEGYWRTTDWIERHPHWVFWGVLSYLVIRR